MSQIARAGRWSQQKNERARIIQKKRAGSCCHGRPAGWNERHTAKLVSTTRLEHPFYDVPSAVYDYGTYVPWMAITTSRSGSLLHKATSYAMSPVLCGMADLNLKDNARSSARQHSRLQNAGSRRQAAAGSQRRICKLLHKHSLIRPPRACKHSDPGSALHRSHG